MIDVPELPGRQTRCPNCGAPMWSRCPWDRGNGCKGRSYDEAKPPRLTSYEMGQVIRMRARKRHRRERPLLRHVSAKGSPTCWQGHERPVGKHCETCRIERRNAARRGPQEVACQHCGRKFMAKYPSRAKWCPPPAPCREQVRDPRRPR